MNSNDIIAQSKAAYGQWAEQWRAHAQANSKFKMKPLGDFRNTGIGKAVLCVANGYSFEENIEVIKEHKNNVDILACDKTLGHLLANGIAPTYVLVCDANVSYEKYLEKYKDQLQDTILLMNVCANPEWAEKGNWKDRYFFINKDVLKSEREFSEISGCKNFIPAGTNVSNAMVVMLNQSDDSGRQNFFGYDKILLIGFDYSWRYDGKYYAFDEDGAGKRNYMAHVYCTTESGKWAYSSGNLCFSMQWLEMYIKAYDVPAVQCSRDGILSTIKKGNLKDQMQYKYKTEDANTVQKIVCELKVLQDKIKAFDRTLIGIERDHRMALLRTT